MDFIATITDLLKSQRDSLSTKDFVGMHFTVEAPDGPDKGVSKSYVATGVTDDGRLLYRLANHPDRNEVAAFFPTAPVFEKAELYLGERHLEVVRKAKAISDRRAKIDLDPKKVRAEIDAAASRRTLEAAYAGISRGQSPSGREMLFALIDVYPEIATGPEPENEASLGFLIDVHQQIASGERSSLSDRQYVWVLDIVKNYGKRIAA